MKGLLFLGSILAMYGLLYMLFPLDAMMDEFREMGVWLSIGFVALFVLCMFLYDWLLMGAVMYYANKVQPKFKFLHR